MPVHLIIDGYNLLGAGGRGGADLWSEAARDELLRRLSGYRHRKGHAVTVVFDGWRTGNPAEQHGHQAGIEVIYSRRGQRADEVIRRLATDYRQDCAVVSSDREVGNAARAVGAFVITAMEFWTRLTGAPARVASVPFKELDSGRDASESRRGDKKGNPRKLPKSLRRRRQHLKGF
jgi:predicted RNA-binding protein with PIN domain